MILRYHRGKNEQRLIFVLTQFLNLILMQLISYKRCRFAQGKKIESKLSFPTRLLTNENVDEHDLPF